MKNKVLKFLFPIPTIVITALWYIASLLSVGFAGSLLLLVTFFILVALPLDLIIWIAKKIIDYFKRPKTEIREVVKVKCPNCGKLLGTDYLFCTSCGYSLTKPATSVPKPIETKTQPIAQKPKVEEKPVGIMESKLTPELERFAEKCVAYCELDKKQNPKTPEFEGNFRFDDKRFIDMEWDMETDLMLNDDALNEIADIIVKKYDSLGVKVYITDYTTTRVYVVFKLIPGMGVKQDIVLGLQNDITCTLGVNVIMNVVSKDGYIGVLVPVDYCKNFKTKYDDYYCDASDFAMDEDILKKFDPDNKLKDVDFSKYAMDFYNPIEERDYKMWLVFGKILEPLLQEALSPDIDMDHVFCSDGLVGIFYNCPCDISEFDIKTLENILTTKANMNATLSMNDNYLMFKAKNK